MSLQLRRPITSSPHGDVQDNTGILAAYQPSRRLTAEQALVSRILNRNRAYVEWIFGQILALWPYIDNINAQKLFSSNIAGWYWTAVILYNFNVCYYGNVCFMFVAEFYLSTPPTPNHYLNDRH